MENDVVERMLAAWYGDTEGLLPWDKLQLDAMTAAYQVARAQIIAEALADVTDDEWGKASPETRAYYNRFLTERKNRLLAQADKPRTRVEIVKDEDTNDCYDVYLDGRRQHTFCGMEHAERYAAGLRAELEKAQ
jgi:hypothetical protein